MRTCDLRVGRADNDVTMSKKPVFLSLSLRLCSVDNLHCVSKKTGPLLHFQITPTILTQYQQILVQRIASYSALNRNCYFVINVKNRVPAEVFLWHPQQRQLHGNTPTKQRQSRNFKSLNIIMSTKLELLISDIILRSLP